MSVSVSTTRKQTPILTPAVIRKDFANDVWHWGDWDPDGDHKDMLKWFYPVSCMLNFNGTVDYYLNENNELEKVDGTASGVANMAGTNNAMMEWAQDDKLIYWNIIPDSDGMGFTFEVANYQASEDMRPWNHYDANGAITKHFYTAKYFRTEQQRFDHKEQRSHLRTKQQPDGSRHLGHRGLLRLAI